MEARGSVFKYGDNIDTDVIIPARYLNTQNARELADHCMEDIDKTFITRVQAGDIMVGGENFGCGSSREHAAIGPMYLGVKAVLARSISRIHRSNLINYGIVPVLFADPADYEAISAGDELMMEDAPGQLLGGDGTVRLRNLTTGRDIPGTVSFTDKELELLLAGGLLPYIHNRHNGGGKP